MFLRASVLLLVVKWATERMWHSILDTTLDAKNYGKDDATAKSRTILKSSMFQLSKYVCGFSVLSFYQKLLTIL